MAFSVQIQVGMTAGSGTVLVTPDASQVISDAEASAFGLDSDGLSSLWKNVFSDGSDNVALHDPCRDNAMWYQQYGWAPVTTSYQVVSSAVTGISNSATAAATATFTNSTGQTAQYQPSLSASTTNTVSNTTSASSTVGASQTIKYGISFLGSGGGGETTLNYSHTWGEEKTESSANTFTLQSAAAVPVPAGATVTATMMLEKCTMTVQIVYAVSLTGLAEANYGHQVNDHYIWAHDVNDLLTKGNKPTTIQVTETLTIDFFANASMKVTGANGALMAVPPLVGAVAPDAS